MAFNGLGSGDNNSTGLGFLSPDITRLNRGKETEEQSNHIA